MKSILLLILLLSSVSFSQTVRERRGYCQCFENSIPTTDSFLTSIHQYYPNGRLKQITEYDFSDCKIGDTTITTYDTLNNIHTTISKNSKSVVNYDSTGKVLESRLTRGDSTQVYTYERKRVGLHYEEITYLNSKEIHRMKFSLTGRKSKNTMGDWTCITRYDHQHQYKKKITRGEVIENRSRNMKSFTYYKNGEIKKSVSKCYHKKTVITDSTFKNGKIVERIDEVFFPDMINIHTKYYYTYY